MCEVCQSAKTLSHGPEQRQEPPTCGYRIAIG
jgi:hypothetical protein